YSLTLTLAGLLAFLVLPGNFPLACLAAGLCFGCAATFKQTAGVLALSGFLLFLILADDPRARPDRRAGPALPAAIVRAARLLMRGGVLACCAAYLWPRNTAWNVIVLASPAALTLAAAVRRELRAPTRPGMQAGMWGGVWAGAGAGLPLLAVAG